MPQIDVSDVLSDPDLAGEPFRVLRRSETVNSFGEGVLKQTVYDAIGSISPTGDQSLVREEAYSQDADTIRVITTFRLRGASKDMGLNYQPDLVMWNDSFYIVKAANDFSRYGAGFIDAECIQIDYVGTAPSDLPGPTPPGAAIPGPAGPFITTILSGLPGCNTM